MSTGNADKAVKQQRFHLPCPIWGTTNAKYMEEPKNAWFWVDWEREIVQVNSLRAEGRFQWRGSWLSMVLAWLQENPQQNSFPIDHIQQATDREKANLSYWIYQRNLETHLLSQCEEFYAQAPCVDYEYVVDCYRRTPTSSERLLSLVREMARQKDIAVPGHPHCEPTTQFPWRHSGYLRAACAAKDEGEASEYFDAIYENGWVKQSRNLPWGQWPEYLTLKARLWAEEKQDHHDRAAQVFVAMSFNENLEELYTEGIKPGIEQAGYKSFWMWDDAYHSDSISDRMLTHIRQSAFVVADFTCCYGDMQQAVCAGAYYEAGFARGLGKTVIYTCHEDCIGHLHFDTRQILHYRWRKPKDLIEQIRDRLQVSG